MMQMMIQEKASSIMDLVAKPGNSRKERSRDSYASFSTFLSGSVSQTGKGSSKDYAKGKSREAGGKKGEFRDALKEDYSQNLCLVCPGQEPQVSQLQQNADFALPQGLITDEAAQSSSQGLAGQLETASIQIAVEAEPVIGADVDTVLDASATAAIDTLAPKTAADEATTTQNIFQEAFGLSAEPDREWDFIMASPVQGKRSREADLGTEVPIVMQEAKGVLGKEAEFQTMPQETEHSAKDMKEQTIRMDRLISEEGVTNLASIPKDSSGSETNLNLDQEEVAGQIGLGTHPATADSNPVQSQETFIGRMAKVLQEQMIDKSEVLNRKGVAEIRLELKPEYLGRLLVRLSLIKGAVNARFVVENHQVRNLIENNMTQLKQCLADQGIEWQNASVDVGGSDKGFAYKGNGSDDGKGNNGHQNLGQDKAVEESLRGIALIGENSSISYLA